MHPNPNSCKAAVGRAYGLQLVVVVHLDLHDLLRQHVHLLPALLLHVRDDVVQLADASRLQLRHLDAQLPRVHTLSICEQSLHRDGPLRGVCAPRLRVFVGERLGFRGSATQRSARKSGAPPENAYARIWLALV